MSKIFAFCLVAVVYGVSGGLLPTLPILPELGDILSTTVINSTFIQSVTSTGHTIQYDLANGIITISDKNNVGTVALPLDSLCHIPGVNDYMACFICNNDCLYVNNTFGGTCGPNPQNKTIDTCLCADSQADATSRGISTNSTATCVKYNPIGDLEDQLLRPVLRTRMAALQCVGVQPDPTTGYDSTGCQADCVQNHGYKNGTCKNLAPQVQIGDPTYDTDSTLFCECSN